MRGLWQRLRHGPWQRILRGFAQAPGQGQGPLRRGVELLLVLALAFAPEGALQALQIQADPAASLGTESADKTAQTSVGTAATGAQSLPRQREQGQWSAVGEGQWHWGPRSPRSGFSDRWVRWRLPLPDAASFLNSRGLKGGVSAGTGSGSAHPPEQNTGGQQSGKRIEAVLEIGNPFVPLLALSLYNAQGDRIDSLEPFGYAEASPVRMELRTLGAQQRRSSPSPLRVIERPDPLFQLPVSWDPEAGGWIDLWVKGDGSNRVFPLTLWSPERLDRRQGARLAVMAAFLAVLLAVLVFGVLFSTVVATDFGWPYLLWVASGMAYLLAVSGLGYAYAYPLQHSLHRILPPLFGNITAWALLLVLQRLYRLQPLFPILNRSFELTRILLIAFAVLGVALAWAGTTATRWLFVAQELLWLQVSVLVLIAPVAIAVRRRHPESPLLFLALVPLALGVGMETLENMGLLRWPFRTQVLHWIGTASAVLLTAPILLARMRRKIEEGFQWEGAALIRRRLDAFVLFQREAELRENLQRAILERLSPLMQELESGLEGLLAGIRPDGPSALPREMQNENRGENQRENTGEISPESPHENPAGNALEKASEKASKNASMHTRNALPRQELEEARDRLLAAKAELQVIAENQLPTALERQALGPALEGLAEPLRKAGVSVRIDLVDLDHRWRPEPLLRMALFRTAQGLLSNVLQHAQARECQVQLSRSEEWLTLNVEDDGVGLPESAIAAEGRRAATALASRLPQGRGMDILRQRVQALGGSVRWESAAHKGTRCVVRIPMTI